ncbi:NUDIX domain-containing protein [Candidatus Dojkabacteria bacterium]|nr:NUDIX domain-containing protein [Candidatus Dojkabacteria bacterium]
MKKTHKIQLHILHRLLFSESLRYSQIKPYDMEGSQFKHHMNTLMSDNLVIKDKKGTYLLTSKGKEYANRMHTKSSRMKDQAKITTVLCCVNTKKRPHEYLIYTRKKNPFYGCQGFPTEKVWFGEAIYNAACRGLKEETSLKGKGNPVAVRHYTVFSPKGDLLEDKIMYVFKFENPQGKLQGNEEGVFEWVKSTDLRKKITRPLEEFWEIYALLSSGKGQITFKEHKHITDKF